MENYIGLDAHSKTCMFVVLNSQGKETRRHEIETKESGIIDFIRSLKGKRYLTYEESTLSGWLHAFIEGEVDKLVVCNPCFITKRSGPKNDYLDAVHLAQQLRGGFLTPVFHENNFFADLRKIVNAYESLVEDMARAKNRYKALFISEAVIIESSGIRIFRDEKLIGKLKNEASRFVAQALQNQISEFHIIKLAYLKQFKEYENKYPEIKALASIPGIATVRASIIAAAICSPDRFANKHKFWAYSMLVKHEIESGGRSYGKERIFGKASLKKVYMGAAETILQKGLDPKKYYDQWRDKGLDHKVAKKNLARKIAAISLSVMKTKQDYREVVKEEKSEV